MSRSILIVDDDDLMRRSLVYHLEQAGYRTANVGTAEEGLVAARQSPPDLILLDIGLPGMDGLEALRALRMTTPVPVIFLTARRRELDEILGLELGAEDYITKPFDTDVLLARVRTVLRRVGPAASSTALTVGDLVIDPAAHTVQVQGKAVDLPPRGFDLLLALAREAGKVVSTEELLTRVWGADYEGEPQVVYVHVRWLREKIEENPTHPQRLRTVRGVGYKLVP